MEKIAPSNTAARAPSETQLARVWRRGECARRAHARRPGVPSACAAGKSKTRARRAGPGGRGDRARAARAFALDGIAVNERARLTRDLADEYSGWWQLLRSEFSVLLYGFGSKKELLEDFARRAAHGRRGGSAASSRGSPRSTSWPTPPPRSAATASTRCTRGPTTRSSSASPRRRANGAARAARIFADCVRRDDVVTRRRPRRCTARSLGATPRPVL